MTASHLDEREAFECWAAKAPVRACEGVASAAYRIVKPALLAEERSDALVALDHARIGEGRAEFDALCARIRARLWPTP